VKLAALNGILEILFGDLDAAKAMHGTLSTVQILLVIPSFQIFVFGFWNKPDNLDLKRRSYATKTRLDHMQRDRIGAATLLDWGR
jgi:hypothetical protein